MACSDLFDLPQGIRGVSGAIYPNSLFTGGREDTNGCELSVIQRAARIIVR